MKTFMATLLATIGWVPTALAATGAVVKGTSILIILFIGFVALIVVFQFIPGLVLFLSMLRGLFTTSPKKVSVTEEKK